MILMEISWKTSIEMDENKELNWIQNILAAPNVKTTGDDTYEDFVKPTEIYTTLPREPR